MTITALVAVTMLGVAAVPAVAQPAVSEASTAAPADAPISRSARAEAARLSAVIVKASPATRRNWVRRHPIWTGAIAGGASGFLIGYLPGDDGVFYDYTGWFNGVVLGGVGAGAGAAAVAMVQSARR